MEPCKICDMEGFCRDSYICIRMYFRLEMVMYNYVMFFTISSACVMAFYFQSLPTGEPSLVHPCLDKQDIEQMKKDLPKYEATGLFPAGAREH